VDSAFTQETNLAENSKMNCLNRWLALGLVAVAPQFCGCAQNSEAQATHEHPATVEHIDGSEISRVTLTEHAMKRLDVQVGTVSEAKSPRGEATQKVVPYSALIYDPQGKTWIYTSPQSRVFVRAAVEVDFIEGDQAYLTSGPEPGTTIATVAVAELYGTEFEVGH
jgi:hypothetical protein